MLSPLVLGHGVLLRLDSAHDSAHYLHIEPWQSWQWHAAGCLLTDTCFIPTYIYLPTCSSSGLLLQQSLLSAATPAVVCAALWVMVLADGLATCSNVRRMSEMRMPWCCHSTVVV